MAKLKSDETLYDIKPLELATLIVNLHQAAQHPLIGHGDHIQSLKNITERMNIGTVRIRKTDLEASLWAANMLDELGEFWSPYIDRKVAREFQSMIDRMKFPYGFKFDRFYNTIEDKRRIR